MAEIQIARAWCNNEVAYLAWQTGGKIADCLGFMITRLHLDDKDNVVERRILPAWAAFKTQSNPDWNEQDTSVWPIQKFSWRDLTLRRSRDTTNVRGPDFQVKYEIVAVGKTRPGREAVPRSPDADPSKYTGTPIPLFYCSKPKETNTVSVTTDIVVNGDKPFITAGFTNGILSTQNLRKQLQTAKGEPPSKKQLEQHIDTDKPDPIRTFLTADALPLISAFVARAETENCDLYCSLYELNDPTLLDLLQANAQRVHLILSTAGSKKTAKGSHQPVVWDTTNAQSRATLRDKIAEFHDRMFNNSAHIGHNKFVVLVEHETGKARAVLAGSTNWTFTGLCTQSNNVIIIEDEKVADAYYEYWQRLRDDKLPVPHPISEPNNNKQGDTLRTDDMTPAHTILAADGKTDFTLWYSPNTKAATKTKTSPTPPDLAHVFTRMSNAKDAIFFLTFMPSVAGDQSIIVESIDVATEKNLLVLGAISDGRALPAAPGTSAAAGQATIRTGARKAAKTSAAGKRKSGKANAGSAKTAKTKIAKTKKTKAKKTKARTRKRRAAAMAARSDVVRSPRGAHATKRSGAKPAKASTPATSSKAAKSGKGGPPQPKRAIYTNPKAPNVLMIRAAAIGDFDLIGDWEHEMLKYGQAIIHDKIVVIDPLSEDCVVVTGSHNLGFKASYANDENLLVIKGNRPLAIAYMVHILDVYDHYKFRAILEQQAYERAIGKPGQKPPVGQGILDVDDTWQDKYVNGKPTKQQAYFLSDNTP
jgi:phosphatidylserine/phosphatidylglycerophosphate/cardiolipin synthase-like enzyme